MLKRFDVTFFEPVVANLFDRTRKKTLIWQRKSNGHFHSICSNAFENSEDFQFRSFAIDADVHRMDLSRRFVFESSGEKPTPWISLDRSTEDNRDRNSTDSIRANIDRCAKHTDERRTFDLLSTIGMCRTVNTNCRRSDATKSPINRSIGRVEFHEWFTSEPTAKINDWCSSSTTYWLLNGPLW